MNQQEPYLTGRQIPPHLQQHDVVGDSPLNPRRQDALNQAYHEATQRLDGFGFDNQRDAFEEGWETGYKTADQEWRTPSALEIEAAAHALYADNEVGDWEDGNLDTLLQYRRAAKVVLASYTRSEVPS